MNAADLKNIIRQLQLKKLRKHHRRVPLGDLLTDREENASLYGFGENTTCYDNVLVLGDVIVGENTWIGPNVILDGTGDLVIGDHCSISAGAQIYTHHTVEHTTSMGHKLIQHKRTTIGSGVYIGPNAVIQMGVTIGDRAIIGACAFVNRDVPAGAKVYGIPAKIYGVTI